MPLSVQTHTFHGGHNEPSLQDLHCKQFVFFFFVVVVFLFCFRPKDFSFFFFFFFFFFFASVNMSKGWKSPFQKLWDERVI